MLLDCILLLLECIFCAEVNLDVPKPLTFEDILQFLVGKADDCCVSELLDQDCVLLVFEMESKKILK
ncbi:unnamed protein product [Arabidopsis halleri]